SDSTILLARALVSSHEFLRFTAGQFLMWEVELEPQWDEVINEKLTYFPVEGEQDALFAFYGRNEGSGLVAWKINSEGAEVYRTLWEPEGQIQFKPVAARRRGQYLDVLGHEVRETEQGEVESTTLATFIETETSLDDQDTQAALPAATRIIGTRPNPFNQQLTVEFSLSKSNSARLVLYNLLGRKVWTRTDLPNHTGTHAVTLQPDGLSSGVYLLTLQAGAVRDTRKVIYLR
ncbi:T9SS type A sorting domain-containing protein, partial [bacterium]|nr:T9SS type A sorting domain-containing protein [bacterium]